MTLSLASAELSAQRQFFALTLPLILDATPQITPEARHALQVMAAGDTRARMQALSLVSAVRLGVLDALDVDPAPAATPFAATLAQLNAKLSDPAAMATRSISCMVYCGLCAIALVDAVPGDEIIACLVCSTCAVDI